MIKLYSQPSCGQCRLVHLLLDKKQIPYEDIQDVAKMQEVGVEHTPTLELDDNTRLVGKAILDYLNKGAN